MIVGGLSAYTNQLLCCLNRFSLTFEGKNTKYFINAKQKHKIFY